MEPQSQETKIKNLRVHESAKKKVLQVVRAIRTDKKLEPTLTEAVIIMADHYLATGRNPLAA
jgi:hypothetical protein